MEESKKDTCATCGIEQGHIQRLKKQIKELTDKLEGSQLQNLLLTSDCHRLRHELHEAAFKGRSSLRGRSSVVSFSLPNEILRHIFALATEFGDLAVATAGNHPQNSTKRLWEISSMTRRAIPFVCKQWNAVGNEFLLEHIVLRRISQPRSLLWSLDRLNTIDQGRILGYIRGLEVIMHADVNEAAILGDLTILLLRKLPSGQLRRFGIDCGRCNGTRTSLVTDMLVEVLRRSAGRLEMLHLPCVERPKLDSESNEASRSENRDPWQLISCENLRLKKLSFMDGSWSSCHRSVFGSGREPGVLTALGRCISSVDTLKLGFVRPVDENNPEILKFLDSATNIQNLHLDYMPPKLSPQSFLRNFPNLRRIFIVCISEIDVTWPVGFSHPSLEEITIVYTRRYSNGELVPFVEHLEDQADLNHYPNLKRITMHGYFSNGCLDPHCIFPRSHFKLWEDAIDGFREQGIALVDQENRPIHLWRRRHTVEWNDGNTSASNTSKSEDDQWYETSDEDRKTVRFSSDDGSISDDSDDKPYKYVHQRDLRPSLSDSEGEDE